LAILKKFDVKIVSIRLIKDEICSSRNNYQNTMNTTSIRKNIDEEILIECKVSDLLEYHESHDTGLNISDLSSGSSGLKHINEAALLHILNARYCRDRISTIVSSSSSSIEYPSTSSITLYINPFKSLPDTYDIQKYYSSLVSHRERDAHIYNLPRRAMDAMSKKGGSGTNDASDANNSVIVVTGESGSGKTEATKLMMKFVLDKVTTLKKDHFHRSLGVNLTATSVVLEAFGHCSTTDNRNSSRASTYYKIFFDRSVKIQQIHGIQVSSYLFDKSRVHSQGVNEGNFNIFFQKDELDEIYKERHRDMVLSGSTERDTRIIKRLVRVLNDHRIDYAVSSWSEATYEVLEKNIEEDKLLPMFNKDLDTRTGQDGKHPAEQIHEKWVKSIEHLI